MLVRDVGESRLIELLSEVIGADNGPGLENGGFTLQLGIGDDAAAWSGPAGSSVLTTDTLVDGVHFRIGRSPWSDLGWKAMAVNLSDVAAMGCSPLYAVVTLGLTGDEPVDSLKEIYGGITEASRCFGVVVVGGDVVRSPVLFITVAIVGSAESANAGEGVRPLLTRGAVTPGLVLAVTGSLGCAAAALRADDVVPALDEATLAHLRDAQNRPQPRMTEGIELARRGVAAAMDVSDGLLEDLGKLCKASQVGAIVRADLLPADGFLRRAFPDEWLSLAASGGEDYEILFAAPADVVEAVAAAVDLPVTAIGETTPGAATVSFVDADGEPVHVETPGWDHFRPI